MIVLFFLLFCGINISEASDERPVQCNVSILDSGKQDLPQIVIKAEHLYSSVTNGSPYSKEPELVKIVRLGGTDTFASFNVTVDSSLTQTVTVAYNGTHICSSAQLRLVKDTCWAGSGPGCNNKTNTCDHMCFSSEDFYKRHSLRLFRSQKASSSIGTWSQSHYVSLLAMPNKPLTCYYGNETYSKFDYQPNSFPDLKQVQCSVGERCRVTTGQNPAVSFAYKTYVGCETDSNQYDGCEEGCSFRKYHLSPSGRKVQWKHMCKYCCSESLCNNPYKCKNLDCDLSSDIPEQDKNACSFMHELSCCLFVTVYMTFVHFYGILFA